MTLDDLALDAQGLIPAVVQEADTGEVLMVAWMDRQAVEATLSTGLTHFWSRSRAVPWRKGETSGHSQHVQALHVDCDADTLLVQVHQDGVACHTGNRTCFYRRLRNGGLVEEPAAATMLERLERVVASRKASAPAGSYVGGLLARGEAAVCRKIGEEASEVITAALGNEGDRRVVEEVADLWFHTIVLLGARGIPVAEVLKELARRHAARRAAGG
ncbi:MAG: bifunctional phosphoribosyl-AMP cyclohydrolase/phosphoribosyl-ATP diphosphatase HisIE [Candidatus Rokubacteria bacterium]|nr:bifunctional phosphoribosyl-AMP cyclohydrolase/phosphoribosyl-ATP diphosphatase HisIE [Candidatus Rokubacteria bacterium]